MTGKPEGYSTLSPYLILDGADRTIRFLEEVFDGEMLRRFENEDGGVLHAEVRIGDSVVMVADGNPNWPPIGAHVHVYVADVDASYRKAVDAGAESVQEPKQNEGDEDRRSGVLGPGGTTWWIATSVGLADGK